MRAFPSRFRAEWRTRVRPPPFPRPLRTIDLEANVGGSRRLDPQTQRKKKKITPPLPPDPSVSNTFPRNATSSSLLPFSRAPRTAPIPALKAPPLPSNPETPRGFFPRPRSPTSPPSVWRTPTENVVLPCPRLRRQPETRFEGDGALEQVSHPREKKTEIARV